MNLHNRCASAMEVRVRVSFRDGVRARVRARVSFRVRVRTKMSGPTSSQI